MNTNRESQLSRNERHDEIIPARMAGGPFPLPLWLRLLLTCVFEGALTVFLLSMNRYLPLGRPMPYIVLIGIIAYFLGEWPAILAFILGALCYDYFFASPKHAFWPMAVTPSGWSGWIEFLLGTLLVGLSMVFIRRSEFYSSRALTTAEHEIEERKRAEDEFRASEERFRTLFESMNEGFALCEVVCDDKGNPYDFRFLELNPAFAVNTGLKVDEIVGKTIREVLPNMSSSAIQDYTNVAVTGHPSRFMHYNSDLGRYFDASVYRWAPGKFAMLLSDITERKRREEETARQNAKLREQAEVIDLGHVLIRDAVGRITLWTTGDEQQYGYSKEEAVGRIAQELLHTEFPIPRPEVEEMVLRDGHWEGELIQTRRDGSRLVVASHWVRHSDEQGSPTSFLEVNNDITPIKEAEEEIRRLNAELEERVTQRTAQLVAANRDLENANKELEAFSYSVSHDLRAPLRAIDGFSSALLKYYLDSLDARGQDYLHRVRAATQRMGQLIDDILMLSRATRAEMHIEEIDLTEMALDIIDDLRKSQPDRQVESIVEPGLIVRADSHLIRIALTNLLDNAWKFTSKRPTAKIEMGSFEQNGERVYFIRDNGAGFDPEYADKLFSAFQRLHTESEFPGTGIGLAMVQRILRRHGGRIWAESAVDKGATFYFTIGRPANE